MTHRALSPQEAQCILAHRQQSTCSHPKTKVEDSRSYFEPCETPQMRNCCRQREHGEKSELSEKGEPSEKGTHYTVLPAHSQASTVCIASTSSVSARALLLVRGEQLLLHYASSKLPHWTVDKLLDMLHSPSRTFCSAHGHL